MSKLDFIPDQWLLIDVAVPKLPALGSEEEGFFSLRLDAGQIHVCKRTSEDVYGHLRGLLAASKGTIRVFANGYQELRHAIVQLGLEFEDCSMRVLMYHHDLGPDALLASLHTPEDSTRYGWYLGHGQAVVSPWNLRSGRAMEPQAYLQRWGAAFEVWALATLDGLDEEDALDWYGTDDPEEQAELEVTPPQSNEVPLREVATETKVQSRTAANAGAYRLAASGGKTGKPIERGEASRYTLSCAYPTEAQLNVELIWYANKHLPVLVEFHPKIAMPLLLPVVVEAMFIDTEGRKRWRLEFRREKNVEALELWNDLNAAGYVFIHTIPKQAAPN